MIVKRPNDSVSKYLLLWFEVHEIQFAINLGTPYEPTERRVKRAIAHLIDRERADATTRERDRIIDMLTSRHELTAALAVKVDGGGQ